MEKKIDYINTNNSKRERNGTKQITPEASRIPPNQDIRGLPSRQIQLVESWTHSEKG